MEGGGFAPYGDLYGEAPAKSGAFFALAVYELDLLFLNKNCAITNIFSSDSAHHNTECTRIKL